MQSPAVKLNESIKFGDVSMDAKTLMGKKGRKLFELTTKEFLLMKVLYDNPKAVMDRTTLFKVVWGSDYIGTTRTLDQHILKLRQKIENDPASPKYITTVHREGYRFIP